MHIIKTTSPQTNERKPCSYNLLYMTYTKHISSFHVTLCPFCMIVSFFKLPQYLLQNREKNYYTWSQPTCWNHLEIYLLHSPPLKNSLKNFEKNGKMSILKKIEQLLQKSITSQLLLSSLYFVTLLRNNEGSRYATLVWLLPSLPASPEVKLI